MKKFKFINFLSYLALVIMFSACNSQSENMKNDVKICPQCNMELPKSNIHTATFDDKNNIKYFDDTGCLVLWMNDNKIDIKDVDLKVFSNDTKRYIDAKKAFFSINEKTPMMYGFSAYENPKDGSIGFDDVVMRMLRGEHMANPKIRKNILGY